jgi:hypothetical protein
LFSNNKVDEEINKENSVKYGWDKVFYATSSNNLDKMLSVTELETTPQNRHYLLQSIVAQTYKLRTEEKYKAICIEFSEKHLKEFSVMAPKLTDKNNTGLPRVSTFQHYSTLLTELGEFEKAISVCELAISFGLDDGTKGGYESRIERINKKI